MKTFGLAVICSAVTMAFIGASVASATSTVLCKENILVCPLGQKIEHATVTGLSTNSLLLTNFANVKCTHSIISGTALLLASPLVGHISLIDFTGCTESIFNSKCTVVTNNAGLLKLLKTGPNAGSLSAEGAEALVNCSTIGLHCVYGNPVAAINVTGSIGTALATVSVNGLVLPIRPGGTFCPEKSFWDATYTILTPDPVYIAE